RFPLLQVVVNRRAFPPLLLWRGGPGFRRISPNPNDRRCFLPFPRHGGFGGRSPRRGRWISTVASAGSSSTPRKISVSLPPSPPSGAVEEDATSIDVVSHVDHFLREDLEMPLERLAENRKVPPRM
ncbi:unnamed protein product, partial [Musa acuminata subsp. burmannicoides]